MGNCDYWKKRDIYLEEADDIDTFVNNITNFNYWCATRVLTLDRKYAKELLNSIGMLQAVTDRERAQIALSYRCASLTDVFWVKLESEEVSFGDINLYENHLEHTFIDIALKGKQYTVQNNVNAVWSLLLATGYLRIVKTEYVGEFKRMMLTLALTNMEVAGMFHSMVRGWFSENSTIPYNNFLKALLLNDVEAMNEFMNRIALRSFSSFDIANGSSDDDAPERFYHGFVLGLIVELAGRYEIISNRESGFGRYDIMMIPADWKKDCAYIIEFKVYKPLREKNLEKTLENALLQIEEKQYAAQLAAKGFAPERIRKYGFAFRGKECLIG